MKFELSAPRPVKPGSAAQGGSVALLKNRRDAGRLLAEKLAGKTGADTVVLALPRGGVPVAFDIAQRLHLPLEPLVVRKLGVPHYPEFAMGAIAAGGHSVIDRELVRRLHLSEAAVAAVIASESSELQERERRYPTSVPLASLAGRPALLVDDGMATGSTMLAAIVALRSLRLSPITVAVPVLSREARDRVSAFADAVVCLHQPCPFDAVGQWYADFHQVEADEACALLDRAQRLRAPAPPTALPPLNTFLPTEKESTVEYQTRRQALPWMNLLGGVALGALAMYVADPSQGRRRRSLLQDKVSSATHRTSKRVNQTMRDAKHRLAGLQAEAMRAFAPREVKPLDNHVLEARVRSRLGRAMPGQHGIEVHADAGVVTLSGHIADEAEQHLLDTVAAIPGVALVRHELHTTDAQRGLWTSMLAGRSTWWAAGALGAGALTWYALSRWQPLGLIAAATGLGLMARSGAGQHDSAVGEAGEGIEAQCTIEITAPPEIVYDVWSHYENFPHFMSHVIEVRDLGGERSHWVVQGPGGSEVEFESVLTAAERPSRLAWQSEPGSAVDTEGLVVLKPSGTGTRATVHIAWRPPVGGAGQALAMLTGVDPEQALEDDLRRMKQFIERGLPSGEGSAARTTAAAGISGTAAAGSTGPTDGNVLH